jgi:type IV pilus assembly protein PilF
MKRKLILWVSAILASTALLAGCATDSTVRDEALKSSTDQTDNQKLAHIRLQLAVGYYGQRQIETALDEIKKALQADPNFADAYSMRGLIYMDMGESRLAEQSFLQALKLAPDGPDFNNNYGWFLCQNGRERESIDYFETALESRSYRSPAKALNNAGVCSLQLDDRVAAERYFLQAFQHEPGNVATNRHLTRIYYDRGDNERARFYIRRVMKADVMTPEVLWLAIKIEHKLGDRAAEVSLATQLRRRHGDSSEYAAYERGAFDD